MAGVQHTEKIPAPARISVQCAWERKGNTLPKNSRRIFGFVDVEFSWSVSSPDSWVPPTRQTVSLRAFRKMRGDLDRGLDADVTEHDERGVWKFKVCRESRPPADRMRESDAFYRVSVKPTDSAQKAVRVERGVYDRKSDTYRTMYTAPLARKWSLVMSREELSDFVDRVLGSRSLAEKDSMSGKAPR